MRRRECGDERVISRHSPAVEAGIRIFREGLECCCLGLRQVESNNLCRGLRNIREGLCMCERGFNILCNCLGDDRRRELVKGLRKCSWGIRDIRCGCRSIACGDIRDGAEDVAEGIECCKMGLNMIESVEEECDCGCGC